MRAGEIDAGRGRHELPLEFGEHPVEFFALLERLAVPVVLAFREGDALALHRAGHDHRGLALRGARFSERVEDLVDIVAVDRDGVPAECPPAPGELLESCCHIVARLWPRPLTSVIAQRLSSPSCAATSAASHTEPSADSPSPSRQ